MAILDHNDLFIALSFLREINTNYKGVDVRSAAGL